MESLGGFKEMELSGLSLTPHYNEVVHFAWQKRQEYVLSRKEEYLHHLDAISRSWDTDSAIINARCFLEEMDVEGRKVFLNAYYASLNQIEGEQIDAQVNQRDYRSAHAGVCL